jgi:hypothetical protein
VPFFIQLTKKQLKLNCMIYKKHNVTHVSRGFIKQDTFNKVKQVNVSCITLCVTKLMFLHLVCSVLVYVLEI